MTIAQISAILLFAGFPVIMLAQPTARDGSVTLRIYDADGDEVKDPTVHIKDSSGRDLSKALDRRTMTIHLPVGDYQLLLGTDKGVELQNYFGELHVGNLPQTKVIGLGFASPEIGATAHPVKVRFGARSAARVDCLLSGIFFDRKYVASALAGGELEFSRVESGKYLLRCASEGKLKAFREILVPSQEARESPTFKEDIIEID